MKVAKAVMGAARDHGLEHFFGIPGGGSPLDLIEAGRQLGVEFVNVSHESSAAIAAACYGLLKNSAGLAMSIRGVGAANLAGGVANVYFERLPLVGICEAPSDSCKTESVQQCDQSKLFDGICRFQATLSVQESREQIRQAFASAVDGRPTPSMLHLPAGLGEINGQGAAGTELESNSCATLDDASVRKAKEFIRKHNKIAVLAGADVVRAGAISHLLEFVNSIAAVVLVTMDARGVFPESHPRWAGVFLGLFNPNVIESRVFEQVDAVLFIGVDAMMTHAPWKLSLPACEFVQREEYTTMSTPTVRVNGDLKHVLKAVSGERRQGISQENIRKTREGILPYFQRPPKARLAAQDIIEICRELLPADGLLISETGAFVCMLEHLWPVERTGTFLGTSGGRTMGLMVPAALGAGMADRRMPMIGLGADGSLLMRLGELEAFARNKLAIPLVIINDRALGTMKARQKSKKYPDYGLDFESVDFAAVAAGCGLRGVIVNSPEEFRTELCKAMQANSTTLIDARVDPEAYQQSFSPTIGDLSQLSQS